MNRAPVLGIAAMSAVTAVLLAGVAVSLDDPFPTPGALAQATMTPTRTPQAPTITATSTLRPTPLPTWTPDRACGFYTRDGEVCIKETPTQVVPLPGCAKAAPGQACVYAKPTLWASWMTVTPVAAKTDVNGG